MPETFVSLIEKVEFSSKFESLFCHSQIKCMQGKYKFELACKTFPQGVWDPSEGWMVEAILDYILISFKRKIVEKYTKI